MPCTSAESPTSHSWVGVYRVSHLSRYQAPSVRAQVFSFPYNLLMQCLSSVILRILTTWQFSKICLQSHPILVGFYLNSHICSLDFLELPIGLEPMTGWLQISYSTNWVTRAFNSNFSYYFYLVITWQNSYAIPYRIVILVLLSDYSSGNYNRRDITIFINKNSIDTYWYSMSIIL